MLWKPAAATRFTTALGTAQEPANDTSNPSPWVSFKGRPAPTTGEKVRVYRNLNNGQYSVRALQGRYKGLVLGYAPAIQLSAIQLVISERTRAKAVAEGVRNVHAWSEGIYEGCSEQPPASVTKRQRRITYFPFIKPYFFLRTRPDRAVTELAGAWAYEADLWEST